MPKQKKPQPNNNQNCILATIRLDQAARGERSISRSTVRKLNRSAARLERSSNFFALAGLR